MLLHMNMKVSYENSLDCENTDQSLIWLNTEFWCCHC
jgi:hypothetical protein